MENLNFVLFCLQYSMQIHLMKYQWAKKVFLKNINRTMHLTFACEEGLGLVFEFLFKYCTSLYECLLARFCINLNF